MSTIQRYIDIVLGNEKFDLERFGKLINFVRNFAFSILKKD